jgi:hypothetical protein
MWQLIKDEIRYCKLELYISFFSLPIIFIAIHFIPDMTQQPIQNEGLFIFIFIIILAFNPVIHENRRREKRNRLYRLLNISSTQTALVRVMLSMVCWGSMMILYLILPRLSKIFAPFTLKSLWVVGADTGLVMMSNALFCLSYDAPHYSSVIHEKIKIYFSLLLKITSIILISLTLMVMISHINKELGADYLEPLYRVYSYFFSSFTGMLALISLGVIFIVLSVKSYGWRKSYLD